MGNPLRVSAPWTWALLWTLAAAVAAGLIFASLAKVEVNAQGRGVLQAQGGVRNLFAQVDGSVSKLMAYSGTKVKAGDPILHLESAPTLAALFQSDRQLQQQRSGAKGFNELQDALYGQQVAKLKARIALLSTEESSYGQTIQLYREKVAATEELLQQGIVSQMNVGEAKEALQQARRQQDDSRQSLAQAQQELASLQGQHQGQLLQRAESMNEAVTKREALDYTLRQGDVLAPVDGCLEAMLVKPGDAVRAGQVLGRLVPEGTALQVVSFLPEKDRAFVHAGDVAQVEVDQLPYAEYGILKARVKRVAEDFASPDEISDALAGAKLEGSFVRIELEALPGQGRSLPLRPGMLLSVRYTLRRQRLITVIFDPLRRVFHG
jgi:multidrug resistance efflux pump